MGVGPQIWLGAPPPNSLGVTKTIAFYCGRRGEHTLKISSKSVYYVERYWDGQLFQFHPSSVSMWPFSILKNPTPPHYWNARVVSGRQAVFFAPLDRREHADVIISLKTWKSAHWRIWSMHMAHVIDFKPNRKIQGLCSPISPAAVILGKKFLVFAALSRTVVRMLQTVLACGPQSTRYWSLKMAKKYDLWKTLQLSRSPTPNGCYLAMKFLWHPTVGW